MDVVKCKLIEIVKKNRDEMTIRSYFIPVFSIFTHEKIELEKMTFFHPIKPIKTAID